MLRIFLCLCGLVALESWMVCGESYSQCLPLNLLEGINFDFLTESSETYDNSSLYFCSKNAPLQYRCSCPILLKCVQQKDPWGRNIGLCSCCRNFMLVFFVLIGALICLGLLTLLYALCCRNKWWFDGYPKPLRIKMPRRGPIVPCPVGPSLPRNLFQGYRRNHFLDVLPGDSEQEGRRNSPLFQTAEPHRQSQRSHFGVMNEVSLSR